MARIKEKTKLNAREKLYNLLKDGLWHPYKELFDVAGVRYSARLFELKNFGHQIESRELKGGPGKEYKLV